MTLFVFLTGTARTRIVRTRFLVRMDRFGTCVLTRVTPCCSGSAGSLSGLLHGIFLRTVLAEVLTTLLLSLLYTVGLLLMNLST